MVFKGVGSCTCREGCELTGILSFIDYTDAVFDEHLKDLAVVKELATHNAVTRPLQNAPFCSSSRKGKPKVRLKIGEVSYLRINSIFTEPNSMVSNSLSRTDSFTASLLTLGLDIPST